ncbi:uncharacterized protein LOC124943788 [Impatiens glandulifera]|uniref:uncharacterized protein LOC124943788 n=1 Tax=Impatiens glandulifera TaxID=253017 RepID=UPI001FB0A752|nr:uncharacterized protein LOC124943788 [Impatiens glandulifera]
MGTCSSSSSSSKAPIIKSKVVKNYNQSAMVIDLDGYAQEFKHPVMARQVLSKNIGCLILCNSETLNIGCWAQAMAEEEELMSGHIYFLMPMLKSHSPVSLHELCSMAIKASKVL